MTPAKVNLQNLRLDTRYKRLKELSRTEFKKIQEFIDLNKNGENTKAVDIGEQTERKYIDAFVMILKNLKGKKLSKLTKEDLTKLKQSLKSGKIKSRIKQPYSQTSQREMTTLLIRYLEFLNPEKYSGYRKWFVTKVQKKSIERLKEDEILKLFKGCKTNRERFLIAVLFDTGSRASEFLNIRYEDITTPTPDFPYYKIDFKTENSKTEGRNIGLYWKYSTEAIRDYLAEIGELKPKQVVYPKTYDSIRVFLTRLGKRILNKRIHFHIFRKSSASYYACKLTSRQQLCYRYGWKFSSDVPDVYIHREQGEELVKDTMQNFDMQKLETENQELKTKFMLQRESNLEVQKQIGDLKKMVKTGLAIELRKLGISKPIEELEIVKLK